MKIKSHPNISEDELFWFQKQQSDINTELFRSLLFILPTSILIVTGCITINSTQPPFNLREIVYFGAAAIQLFSITVLFIFGFIPYIRKRMKLRSTIKKMYKDKINGKYKKEQT